MLINSEAEAIQIFQKIKSLLIPKYNARFVNSYACKIEIFDEKYGKYILAADKYNGSDFHYVTLDIQFYLKKNNLYECLYFINPTKRLIKESILIPTSIITLQEEQFNSPNNIEEFLKKIYGSLDKNAKYNPKIGLYY